MRTSKNNILICSNVQGQSYLKDIQCNLFKVFCAILNLRSGQRIGNSLDENLFHQYLDQIDGKLGDDLYEQFNVIKNLINRPEFFLNDRQTLVLHQKFKNMCVKRKQFVYNEKKMLNGERADKEMYPVQVVQHRQVNKNRYDVMYNEAMEKRQRRAALVQ